MRKQYLICFLLLQVVLFFGGCGGGGGSGGGGSPAPSSQVAVLSVESLADGAIVQGSSVQMAVTLRSDSDLRDLGMSWYLLSEDAATKQLDSYPLGHASIPVVSLGDHRYTQTFLFPGNVPPGTYHVLLEVDPLDLLLPARTTRAFEVPDSVTVVVGADPGLPDLVLRSLQLDSSYLVLSQDEDISDGVQRDHLAGTLDVESAAHGATRVVIMAYVETALGFEPIRIWNSTTARFSDNLVLDSLEANRIRSLTIDLFVPGEVAERLAARTLTNVRLVVDPLNAIAENEGLVILPGRNWNNEIILPVRVYRSLAGGNRDGGLDFQTSFNKGFSNNYFGAALDFLGEAWLSAQGIGASVVGSVPVTILGHTFNFLGLTSNAHCNPIFPTDSAYDLNVEFAGMTIYSQSGNANFSWSKTWQIQKNLGYSQTFVIAIVPLNLSAGAAGALGFTTSIAINSAFNGTASPFVDTGAYASAAIDLLIAQGGIRGTLYLIGANFTANIGGTVSTDATASQISGTLNETVSYTLKGPNGSLVAYVQWPKTCWDWGIFPYPCGWDEADWSIVNWESYSKTDTLLDDHQSITIPLK